MAKASGQHPLVGRSFSGWWGITTKYAQMSEVHAMRAFADGSLSVRGDSDTCELVEVEIRIVRVVERDRRRKA